MSALAAVLRASAAAAAAVAELFCGAVVLGCPGSWLTLGCVPNAVGQLLLLPRAVPSLFARLSFACAVPGAGAELWLQRLRALLFL